MRHVSIRFELVGVQLDDVICAPCRLAGGKSVGVDSTYDWQPNDTGSSSLAVKRRRIPVTGVIANNRSRLRRQKCDVNSEPANGLAKRLVSSTRGEGNDTSGDQSKLTTGFIQSTFHRHFILNRRQTLFPACQETYASECKRTRVRVCVVSNHRHVLMSHKQ